MISGKYKNIKQKKSFNSETGKYIKPNDPVYQKLLKNEQRSQRKRRMKNKHVGIINLCNIDREEFIKMLDHLSKPRGNIVLITEENTV